MLLPAPATSRYAFETKARAEVLLWHLASSARSVAKVVIHYITATALLEQYPR